MTDHTTDNPYDTLAVFAKTHFSAEFCSLYSDRFRLNTHEANALNLELYGRLYDVLQEPGQVPAIHAKEIPFLMNQAVQVLHLTDAKKEELGFADDQRLAPENVGDMVARYYRCMAAQDVKVLFDGPLGKKQGAYDGNASTVFNMLSAPRSLLSPDKAYDQTVHRHLARFMVQYPAKWGIDDYFRGDMRLQNDRSTIQLFCTAMKMLGRDYDPDNQDVASGLFFSGQLRPGLSQYCFFFAQCSQEGKMQQAFLYDEAERDLRNDFRDITHDVQNKVVPTGVASILPHHDNFPQALDRLDAYIQARKDYTP